MLIFAKLIALLKPKQAPVVPATLYADAEFLEVVAKQWKQRYKEQADRRPTAHAPSPAQAAA